eukprot:s1170_g17.t1
MPRYLSGRPATFLGCEVRAKASYGEEEIRDFRRAFDEFDVDHSDAIDRDEMGALLKPLGLELKTKDDQKRLMNLLNAARASAAESGVDAVQCGKMNTAVVRFPVFVHMCRLLQREKEAKALAEEEAEAARLGFTEPQIKSLLCNTITRRCTGLGTGSFLLLFLARLAARRKLHSSFCLWAARTDEEAKEKNEEAKNEKELLKAFNELATLPVDSFCEFLKQMNSRLSDTDLEHLRKLLAALRDVQAPGDAALLHEDGVIHAELREVSFPLFVRCLRSSSSSEGERLDAESVHKHDPATCRWEIGDVASTRTFCFAFPDRVS